MKRRFGYNGVLQVEVSHMSMPEVSNVNLNMSGPPETQTARWRNTVLWMILHSREPHPVAVSVQDGLVHLSWANGSKFSVDLPQNPTQLRKAAEQISYFVRREFEQMSFGFPAPAKPVSDERKVEEMLAKPTTATVRTAGVKADKSSARAGFYGKSGLSIGATYSALFMQNEKVPAKDRLTDAQIVAELRKEFPGRANFYPVQAIRNKFNKRILPGIPANWTRESKCYGPENPAPAKKAPVAKAPVAKAPVKVAPKAVVVKKTTIVRKAAPTAVAAPVAPASPT